MIANKYFEKQLHLLDMDEDALFTEQAKVEVCFRKKVSSKSQENENCQLDSIFV